MMIDVSDFSMEQISQYILCKVGNSQSTSGTSKWTAMSMSMFADIQNDNVRIYL